MNLENTFLIKNLTKNTLNIGTNKIIPIKSVKNPGISKKTPQINKTMLLNISIPGCFVVNIDCLACIKEVRPWYLRVAIPTKAVKSVNNIVETGPISVPIFTKK